MCIPVWLCVISLQEGNLNHLNIQQKPYSMQHGLRFRGFYKAILQFLLDITRQLDFTNCIIYASTSTTYFIKKNKQTLRIYLLHYLHLTSIHTLQQKKLTREILTVAPSKFTPSKFLKALQHLWVHGEQHCPFIKILSIKLFCTILPYSG